MNKKIDSDDEIDVVLLEEMDGKKIWVSMNINKVANKSR